MQTAFHINVRRFDLKAFIVAMIIVFSALPKELTLIAFPTYLTRPYGSVISISFTMLLTAVLFVCCLKKIRFYKKTASAPIIQFLFWALLSIVFILFNNASVENYLAAAIKFVFYILLYFLLADCMNFKSLMRGIDGGFRLGMIIQTTAGCAYVFFGILIPLFGNYSTNYRNSFSRMVGSFAHPGDFSMYIAILTVYFVSRLLFAKEKGSIIYIAMGAVDLLFSGARAMLLCTFLVSVLIVINRYRKSMTMKILVIVSVIAGIVIFVQSDTFQNLFITLSFVDMLGARLIHWVIGFKIMTRDFVNFLFGVGLNSNVDFINAHYSEFSSLIVSSTILSDEFASTMPIHNSYLIQGVELGIVGLILYIRVYLSSILRSAVSVRKKLSLRTENVFLIAALGTYAIYALQGWALQKNFAMVMLMVVLAMHRHVSAVNRAEAKAAAANQPAAKPRIAKIPKMRR